MRVPTACGIGPILALLFWGIGCGLIEGQGPDFRRQVLPILSDSCFSCHGPDAGDRQADLRLDDRDAALRSGVLSPDDPASSELLERIGSDDPDLHMPPPGSRKDLTAEQRQILKEWIEAGAVYEQHWAWRTPVRPEVPAAGEGWARNPIDRFIAAGHAAHGLQPAPRAEPATLVRRMALDLTGLPPQAVQAPEARQLGDEEGYRKAVETLLASPHFGERMASEWLDLVRYADTVGYHGDQNQNVFPYRDWVIRSINDNQPFDEFVRWQLAGDLIANPTVDSRTATAFNRLNMVTREGGAQPGEYLAKYSADRVRTLGTAFLGVTLACAECHDHKFDPVTTRDFYSLAAYFADIRQWGVYQDYGYTPNPDLRGWSNDHPFPPELEVEVPALVRRIEAWQEQRQNLLSAEWDRMWADPVSRAAVRSWWQSVSSQVPDRPAGWVPVVWQSLESAEKGTSEQAKPEAAGAASAPEWTILPEGGLAAAGADCRTMKSGFAVPVSSLAALRLTLVGDPDQPGQIAADPGASSQLQLQLFRHFPESEGRKPARIAMHVADSRHKLPGYANGFEVDGIHQGWGLRGDFPAGTFGVWIPDRPVHLQAGEFLSLNLSGNLSRRLRVEVSSFVPDDLKSGEFAGLEPVASSAALAADDAGATAPKVPVSLARFIALQWIAATDQAESLRTELRRMDREIRLCREGRWPVLVTEAVAEPAATRVLARGNWQDTSGELVLPATPGFLPRGEAPVPVGARQNRLDLANWLVDPQNPLTARVQMNRLWRHFFGTGLSPVLEDLGAQGQYPSHPELLDWLAVEFRESGWDRKHMIRLIIDSATWQQSSRPSPAALAADPSNQWWARQNPRRLEAEIVRDNALVIAGLLNREIGGPPAFPWQPAGYYSQLQFPDRDYRPDTDRRQYRRGVYMHWQRTFLHPMLANFDAPSREESCGQRIEANTPQQALTLLNDPVFVEAARGLALRSLESHPADLQSGGAESLVRWMLSRTLGRDATGAETESLVRFFHSQCEHFAGQLDDARKMLATGLPEPIPDGQLAELAARMAVARVLLNLHETVTRY